MKQSRNEQIFWLKVAAILILLLSIIWTSITPAIASIRQIEETPRQILSQSRQTLKDSDGNTWQVILFKRNSKNNQSPLINLRLVGFPGVVEFVHPQDLSIETRFGVILNASDIFATESPSPNVGQYDLSLLANQLEANNFWELYLPLTAPEKIKLRIPYFVIEEWQKVINN